MKKALFFFAIVVIFLTSQATFALSTGGDFSDVSGGTRYSEAINFIADQGIVQGYSDGTYKPIKKINRAEFTKIIIEAQFPGQAYGANCFSDVNDEWFAQYVCFAKLRVSISS